MYSTRLLPPVGAIVGGRMWCFIISMTIFGLWHGAKWTYIVYGVYHGLVLVMHRLGQRMKRQFSVRLPRYLGAFLSWGTTFCAGCSRVYLFSRK